MTVLRTEHSGIAGLTTLASDITAGALAFTVATGGGTGYPTGAVANFLVTLDRDVAGKEEKILCSGRTGDSFTVAASGRGKDQTSAVSHTTGGQVEHTISAYEYDDMNKHLADINVDDHTQYLNNARHDVSGRHGFGAALAAPGVPANVTKAAAAAGTAAEAARADHKHDVATDVPADVTKAAAAEGTSTSLARSDHKHDISTAAPSDVTKATAAEGTATSLSRSDHKHDISTAAPGLPLMSDAAAEGSAASLARSDHKHGRNIASDSVFDGEARTLTTYGDLATAGPSVSITTGESALVHLSANLGGTVGSLPIAAVKVSGATTRAASEDEAIAIYVASASAGVSLGRTIRITGLTPGINTFTLVYRSAVGSSQFAHRHLVVEA